MSVLDYRCPRCSMPAGEPCRGRLAGGTSHKPRWDYAQHMEAGPQDDERVLIHGEKYHVVGAAVDGKVALRLPFHKLIARGLPVALLDYDTTGGAWYLKTGAQA